MRSAARTPGAASRARARRSRSRAGRPRRARGPRRRPARRARGSRRARPRRHPGRRSSRGTGTCARCPRGSTGPIERFGRPGITLTTVFGKEQVELAALDLAGRVVDAAAAVPRRPDLRRDDSVGLQAVAVGRDVERLREARVRDGAVVALEEVLDAHLPVARVLGRLRPGVEAKRVDVEATVGEQGRQLAEGVGEWLGVEGRVDEDERPPRVDGDRCERDRGHVEAGLAVRPRCVAQTRRRGCTSRRGRGTGWSPAAHLRRRGRDRGGGRRSRIRAASRRAPASGRPAVRRPRPAPADRARRPGRGGPAYCQLEAKRRSCSRRATAGSTYQSYGSVRSIGTRGHARQSTSHRGPYSTHGRSLLTSRPGSAVRCALHDRATPLPHPRCRARRDRRRRSRRLGRPRRRRARRQSRPGQDVPARPHGAPHGFTKSSGPSRTATTRPRSAPASTYAALWRARAAVRADLARAKASGRRATPSTSASRASSPARRRSPSTT